MSVKTLCTPVQGAYLPNSSKNNNNNNNNDDDDDEDKDKGTTTLTKKWQQQIFTYSNVM